MRKSLLVAACLLVAGCEGPESTKSPAGRECGLEAQALREKARARAEAPGGIEYVVGYVQVSADNQDPFVAKLEGRRVRWCALYSAAPPDERGEQVVVDPGGAPWVAFSVEGGNTELKATPGAFQSSYGQGGGPRVTFLARLSPEDGRVEAATFLRSTLSSGKSNSFQVKGLGFPDGGHVEVRADAWYTPPLVPAGTCLGDSPFDWTGRLTRDLKTLVAASAPGCG
jgi:hypothetical protein